MSLQFSHSSLELLKKGEGVGQEVWLTTSANYSSLLQRESKSAELAGESVSEW